MLSILFTYSIYTKYSASKYNSASSLRRKPGTSTRNTIATFHYTTFCYEFVSCSCSAIWILQYLVWEVSSHCSRPFIGSTGWAFQTDI